MTGLDPVEVDASRSELVKAGDWRGLLDLLYDVRFVKGELTHLERDIEDDAARLMPKKIVQTARVTAERRMSTDRRNWQHEELAKEVLKREWGNIDHPQDVARILQEYVGWSYWRVTKLREKDIDPDEYCETTPGRATVQLRERDHA